MLVFSQFFSASRQPKMLLKHHLFWNLEGWQLPSWELTYIWGFLKIVGFPPKSFILIGFSINYKPSNLGYQYFWKHPYPPTIAKTRLSHFELMGLLAMGDVLATFCRMLWHTRWSTGAEVFTSELIGKRLSWFGLKWLKLVIFWYNIYNKQELSHGRSSNGVISPKPIGSIYDIFTYLHLVDFMVFMKVNMQSAHGSVIGFQLAPR